MKVRKAVFPVAGLGTRVLPATKAMPKEMLTIVDRPLIQYVVDEAREAGIPEAQIGQTLRLAREAHRTALTAAHFEDLRAILGTWRWLHRWVAVFMVALVLVHVIHALAFGTLTERGPG